MNELKTQYRDNTQRNLVVSAVEALLNISRQENRIFSKETLQLIIEKYITLVDPPDHPYENQYSKKLFEKNNKDLELE